MNAITKLYDRNTGRTAVENYISSKPSDEKYGFFLIKLERLGELNKMYGFVFGDAILLETAYTLYSIENAKGISFRIGGLEFALFIKGITDKEIQNLPKYITTSISNVYSGEQNKISLDCKIGFYVTDRQESFENLLNYADISMSYSHMKGYTKFTSYNMIPQKFDISLLKIDKPDRTSYKSDRAYLNGHEDIIKFAFKLLERSEDLKSAIQILISIVARTLDLDYIIIFENNKDILKNKVIYNWMPNNIMFDYEHFEEYLNDSFLSVLYNSFDKDGICTCLSEQADFNMEDAMYLSAKPSIFYNALYENGQINGAVLYVRKETNFLWSSESKSVLKEITNILSTSISRINLDIANKTKTSFFNQMSQELRTPMNAIIGFTDLILSEPESTEKILEYANDIKSSSYTLLNIINELIDVSKMETGKYKIINNIYNLSALFDEVRNVTKLSLEKKNLKFYVDVDSNIPSIMSGDNNRIRQILTNLLNNAIKFTPEGSIIFKLTAKEIDEENIMLEFSITDTGIGIKDSDLAIIFNSFEKLDYHSTYTSSGTGLGLPIARYLARLMGGDISVTSKYNVGSTFYFTVPQKVIDKTPCTITNPNDITLRNYGNVQTFEAIDTRILIIENNELNLKVINGLLGRYKILADKSSDAYDALKYLRINSYDMIFVSLNLPVINGTSTMKYIKQLYGEKTIVIAISDSNGNDLRNELIGNGFNELLLNPINLNTLENILKDYIPVYKMSFKQLWQNSIDNTVQPDFSIKDIDLNLGAFNCGNNIDQLIKLLEVFYRFGGHNISVMRKIISKRDFEKYKFFAQSMKNSSVSIGALKLSKMFAEHEEFIINEDYKYIVSSHTSLIEYYKSVLKNVGKYLKENHIINNIYVARTTIESTCNMSDERYKEIFLDTIRIINRFEKTKAEKLLNLILEIRTDDYKSEMIREALNALEKYDFKSSAQLLKRIC